MKKPLVYIAGPFTFPDPIENTHNAMLVWDRLWASGLITPICPHWTLCQHMLRPRPYQEWLDFDLELLARCDALLRIPGESKGADKEVLRATERGIPVFTTEPAALAWAERWCRERAN